MEGHGDAAAALCRIARVLDVLVLLVRCEAGVVLLGVRLAGGPEGEEGGAVVVFLIAVQIVQARHVWEEMCLHGL